MTLEERDQIIANRKTYMTIGDLDKPFHRPECCCEDCEGWRRGNGRPTFKYLESLDKR